MRELLLHIRKATRTPGGKASSFLFPLFFSLAVKNAQALFFRSVCCPSFTGMAPSFAPSLASAFSLGLLLQWAFAGTVERRYDSEEIKVDESKHDQQFFNFVTVRSFFQHLSACAY